MFSSKANKILTVFLSRAAYLIVLLPLVVLALYQNYSSSILKSQENTAKLDLTGAAIKDDTVLLKIGATEFNQLTEKRLKDSIKITTAKRDAVAFLTTNLKRAKKNANSSFAGFALAGYQRLDNSIKHDPDVLSIYADLLAYTHQFYKAEKVLNVISKSPIHYEYSTIKLLNISMLLGNLKSSKSYCKSTKKFKDFRIPVACNLWVNGMESKSERFIAENAVKLISLVGVRPPLTSVDQNALWIRELALDLQLKANSLELLEENLESIQRQKAILQNYDLSSVIQVVDYFLINENRLSAYYLDKYDENNQLTIRRIIANEKLKFDCVENAMENCSSDIMNDYESEKTSVLDVINRYIAVKDLSKFRLIAMWYWLAEKDIDKAMVYATESLDIYQSTNDRLLAFKMRKNRQGRNSHE